MIHENVDIVLGIKNAFKLEGAIMNRSLPICPRECFVLKPKEQKLIKVKAPFTDEISGVAIIRILDGSTYSTMLIKLKFT